MSNAVRYAQQRRDAERAALDQLENLVPQHYIDAVLPVDPKDTRPAILAKATSNYVATLVNATNNQTTTTTAAAPTNNQTAAQTPITPTTPAKLKNNEEYQRLKQAMERVKHIVQGRAADEDDVSEEVKTLMDEAHDSLVEFIHKVEGDRAEGDEE